MESAILRGTGPDRLIILVGPNNSVEVVIVVVCRRPFEIISPPPLLLEVPQRDISPLGISRMTSWVCSVGVMSGEFVLRGVSEQLLAESDEALPPATSIVQLLCDSKLLRLVGSLLSGSSPPAQQEDREDESATEGHEKNLPPLESVGIALCWGGGGGRRVDSGDTG